MGIQLIGGLAVLLVLTGCAQRLRPVRESDLGQNMPQIDADACPVLAWRGGRTDLRTYWGAQTVAIEVEVWLPPQWEKPGDEVWRVAATTGMGIPLPFIGVVRTYAEEDGRKLAELWPPLDLKRAPDGLYVIVYPNITTDAGEIVRVAPEAALREIRGRGFQPFEARVPLFPTEASPVTPQPEWQPPVPPPAGTPIPVR